IFLAFLPLLAVAAMGIALAAGSVAVAPAEVFSVLLGEGDALSRRMVLEALLRRASSSLATGGLLALAGRLMPFLPPNPSSDPPVLGVSGGAAVGALLVIMLGATGIAVGGAAFGGALASTLLVFSLAHGRGDWAPARLLLTGVVIAAGWGALISLLLAIGPDA